MVRQLLDRRAKAREEATRLKFVQLKAVTLLQRVMYGSFKRKRTRTRQKAMLLERSKARIIQRQYRLLSTSKPYRVISKETHDKLLETLTAKSNMGSIERCQTSVCEE